MILFLDGVHQETKSTHFALAILNQKRPAARPPLLINLAIIIYRRWLIGEYLNGAPPSSIARCINARRPSHFIHLESLTLPCETRSLHDLSFDFPLTLRHSRHFSTVPVMATVFSLCRQYWSQRVLLNRLTVIILRHPYFKFSSNKYSIRLPSRHFKIIVT